MTTLLHRISLWILAASAAYVGAWAGFAPASFYRSFPGAGRHWVDVLGPYNEHLVRDVGSLYLALLALTMWTALRMNAELVKVTGLAWLVFSIPHLVFHLGHLGMLETIDAIGNVVTLGGTLLLAMALLLPLSPRTAQLERESV